MGIYSAGKNWPIKKKISVAVGAGICGMLALNGLALLNNSKLHQAVSLGDSSSDTLRATTELLNQITMVEGESRGYVITRDPVSRDRANQAAKATVPALAKLRECIRDHPDQLGRVNEIGPMIQARIGIANQAIDAVDKGGIEAARETIKRTRPGELMDRIRASIAQIDKQELAQSAEANASAAFWSLITKVSVIAGAMFVLVLSLVAGRWLINNITDSLSIAAGLAEAIAAGDLTAQAQHPATDEFGALVSTMNGMAGHLAATMGSISTATEQVALGSDEMRSTAQKLSQGASAQAAAAEETTSAMEQMASSVHQNADNAKQTDRIASKAAADAKEGGKAVAETVRLMKTVAGTIGVIEEIARKTDLLALNAAVEAARAGEHGRGFAVVASEVRKLAERSQAAAAEISRMTNEGVETAESAGRLFDKLVPDIQRTAELVREIAASSAEQNSGTAQVNQAIQQLDQVIQQNAAAAEQMAATAEELSGQSQALQGSLSFFRVERTDAPAAQARRPVFQAQNLQAKPASPATKSLLKMHHAVTERATSSVASNTGVELDLGDSTPAFASHPGSADALDREFAEYKG